MSGVRKPAGKTKPGKKSSKKTNNKRNNQSKPGGEGRVSPG